MSDKLLSLGLDVGTTTTQLILSRLSVENRAGAFSVPDMAITGREILYRSPVFFTPLLEGELIDGQALRQLVEAGLVDEIGTLSGALDWLKEEIRREKAL